MSTRKEINDKNQSNQAISLSEIEQRACIQLLEDDPQMAEIIQRLNKFIESGVICIPDCPSVFKGIERLEWVHKQIQQLYDSSLMLNVGNFSQE